MSYDLPRKPDAPAAPKGERTVEGGYSCCPKCGQTKSGFTQRESGVTAVRSFFFDGHAGWLYDTEFEHARQNVTGVCNECGHRFRILAKDGAAGA